MATELAMLPRSGVAISVEEDPRGEGSEAGDGDVGHLDDRRVAGPQHRHDDRQRGVDAAVADARVEARVVAGELLDARDVVAIRAGGAIFAAGDGEAADQRRP